MKGMNTLQGTVSASLSQLAVQQTPSLTGDINELTVKFFEVTY